MHLILPAALSRISHPLLYPGSKGCSSFACHSGPTPTLFGLTLYPPYQVGSIASLGALVLW